MVSAIRGDKRDLRKTINSPCNLCHFSHLMPVIQRSYKRDDAMIYKRYAGTSNNSEREENDTAPPHWAPYADAERDNHDSYRR